MNQGRMARTSAAAVLLALLTPAIARAQDPTRPPQPPPKTTTGTAAGSVAPALACTATINSDSLRVAPTPLAIQAALSSSIGDSITATFPADSKISVVKVGAASPVNSLRLTINTSAAAPGEYEISLKGTKGECSGKLKLAATP